MFKTLSRLPQDILGTAPPAPVIVRRITRRTVVKCAAVALGGLAVGGAFAWRFRPAGNLAQRADGPGVFKGDAPPADTIALWRRRGWLKEAYHYHKIAARDTQCAVCPNHCLLSPGDRSRCRNKINLDGTLYTLAYANPCAMHVDPVEKKPLFHFLPGTATFSIATAGCVFRCLNCQNWDISQKTPEETKSATGPELVVTADDLDRLTMSDMARLSLPPASVVAVAERLNCPSISYTYSEPTAYYEYAYDTSKLARDRKIRNILVTCGFIEERSLTDLAQYLDAAHVDLKGFDEATYSTLNSGRLQPVLDTLKTLRKLGVWFEIINLIVPTYTDKPDRIAAMCDWLAQNIGPDYPIHFSRFHPAHKLLQLPPTPVQALTEARAIARKAGLRYVYIGNVPGLPDSQTTFCPQCGKTIIERDIYSVRSMQLEGGKCRYCGAPIAGVWA